jgi:archaeal type IV pilus assembly protein PilA
MKANRKAIYEDEEAVSPVIAVILMVAITVVLAATVFVLVNELGQDVGQTGPNLGLTTASGTGAEQWNIRITSATQSASWAEYTVILTAGSESYSNVTGPQGAFFETTEGCYRLSTITTGVSLGVGERLQLSYLEGALDPTDDCWGEDWTETDPIPSTAHELEFVHRPTGTSSGTIQRAF